MLVAPNDDLWEGNEQLSLWRLAGTIEIFCDCRGVATVGELGGTGTSSAERVLLSASASVAALL
jgi:hypothetical protein